MTKACTLCGRCCQNPEFMIRIGIGERDLSRWRREGRTDILAAVNHESGWRDEGPCPFLKSLGEGRLGCGIYETRPETCREYPLAVGHMETVNCDMLEPGDTDADVAAFMARTAAAGT